MFYLRKSAKTDPNSKNQLKTNNYFSLPSAFNTVDWS